MKDEITKSIKDIIKKWDKSGIYVISIWINNLNDNPCEPYFVLGYNTEANYQIQIKNASDAIESRWNFAFWLQNEELVFGIDETQTIVKKWILNSGFRYYTYNEVFGDTKIDENTYLRITDAFVDALIDVVKHLHSSGFIAEEFGMRIPIIIHELEYHEQIAKQNIEANSLEILDPNFLSFCRGE